MIPPIAAQTSSVRLRCVISSPCVRIRCAISAYVRFSCAHLASAVLLYGLCCMPAEVCG